MVTRVDPFLGGLGIDATGKFEVQANATVTIGNGTSTGNVIIGGSVGIGTTSPAYQLEIENTGSNAIMVLDRTDGAACFIEGQATRSAFGSVGATPLALAYNSLAVVTIGASGAITVNPDGGSPFTLPTADGTANQFLQTDGSGALSFASATVSDISDLTATAAELNVLDGYTGSVTELNYLDTLHATGVTNTEFDYLDGVTSNIQTQLNARLPLSGGTMTGNIVMSGAQTVDGRDLSVDGTKLDGIESGATADQTAAEILTLIKTVDGAGSGLDADLLDGISSASFLRSDTSDSITSGSLTLDAGDLVVNNGTNQQVFLNGGNGCIEITRAAGGAFIDFKNTTVEDYDARLQESGGSINLNGNRILTTADEGSGNGLDADTLDGVQGSSFLRSDTSDSFTSGTLTISGTALRLNDNVDLEFGSGGGATDAQIYWSGTGLEFDISGGPLFIDMGNDNDFYIRDVNSALANSFTVDVSAGNATALTNVNASNGKLQEGGNALIPAGSIIMYGAAAAPGGWYLCEGGAISRSTYAALFSAIGTTYGVGDGSTTFNVPDFRDRAPYGASTFLLGSKTAGEVDVNGQNSTGTGTSGSTGGSTVADTTGSDGPTTHSVTTSTTNSTTDKDVTNSITVVTGVSAHATHTHTIPSLTVNGHTHSVPALTVTHPGVAVKFIIKT